MTTAQIHSLEEARKRRHYIELANASDAWIQTKASFAIEGIEATEDDAVRAGRMIAGDATAEQIVQELREKYTREK